MFNQTGSARAFLEGWLFILGVIKQTEELSVTLNGELSLDTVVAFQEPLIVVQGIFRLIRFSRPRRTFPGPIS